MIDIEPASMVALWLFVFVLSMFTALMEIQIEGGNGWACCLPTWRTTSVWVKRLLNGKELTGYHIYLTLHMLVLFHLPLLFTGVSWSMEWTILFLFFSYSLFEDFLWFVLNPHFGWPLFKKGNVDWYSHWLGPLPVEYYLLILLSAGCAMMAGIGLPLDPLDIGPAAPVRQLMGWSAGFLLCLFFTILMIIFAERRNVTFRKNDTKPHPGHPGYCGVCAAPLMKKSVTRTVKATVRSQPKRK